MTTRTPGRTVGLDNRRPTRSPFASPEQHADHRSEQAGSLHEAHPAAQACYRHEIRVRSSSDENPHFLPVRLAELKANYAGTRLFKQEIEGVFNDDVEGSLFTLDLITAARIDRADLPDLARVVVAVDPAQTSTEGSDESGIIVAGDDGCGHAYLLADYSLRGSPEQVIRRAVDAYRTHSADVLVFEDQSGGDWLATALRHVAQDIPFRKIHAMRGKYLRAQPVAMLYEQGRVHHAGTAEDFEQLEDQMCAITEDSDRSKAHDDRADALVYAITELRGLSGGSWMGAYSMVKCEECRKVYRDTETKCPVCGLERDVFDPPERQKGPGAQFRDGDGLMGWAEVYAPDRPETAAERNHKYLQQVIAMQQGQAGWPRQSLAGIWKSGGTGDDDGRQRRQTGAGRRSRHQSRAHRRCLLACT